MSDVDESEDLPPCTLMGASYEAYRNVHGGDSRHWREALQIRWEEIKKNPRYKPYDVDLSEED